MRIGIPRAFLYHRYHVLWETFFQALGQEVVLSAPTDKGVVARGAVHAIDEACLSSKVFLGHVEDLIGRCDALFVPRIANFGVNQVLCTKFEALPDIVRNTFRARQVKILDFEIDVRAGRNELPAFLALGRQLGKKRTQSAYTYFQAKQAERAALDKEVKAQEALLAQPGTKILVVGHSYNLYDPCIGQPVLSFLRELDVTPILADVVDRRRALEKSLEISDTLPWLYNRELVGALGLYREYVDGIILLSAFPCGPDSLVNEMIIRRVKGIPILNLLLDSQDGTAGMETRLESFIDIIRFKELAT